MKIFALLLNFLLAACAADTAKPVKYIYIASGLERSRAVEVDFCGPKWTLTGLKVFKLTADQLQEPDSLVELLAEPLVNPEPIVFSRPTTTFGNPFGLFDDDPYPFTSKPPAVRGCRLLLAPGNYQVLYTGTLDRSWPYREVIVRGRILLEAGHNYVVRATDSRSWLEDQETGEVLVTGGRSRSNLGTK